MMLAVPYPTAADAKNFAILSPAFPATSNKVERVSLKKNFVKLAAVVDSSGDQNGGGAAVNTKALDGVKYGGHVGKE